MEPADGIEPPSSVLQARRITISASQAGRPGRNRTRDLPFVREALCWLSYWSVGTPGGGRTHIRIRYGRPA